MPPEPVNTEKRWADVLCDRETDEPTTLGREALREDVQDTTGLHLLRLHIAPASSVAELEAEVERLRQIGDLMQSAASRLVMFVHDFQQGNVPGYEDMQAALEARSAVEDWTAARRSLSPEQEPTE